MARVVITGGSRGLGFECAKALSALGHDLLLVAKDSDRLATARECFFEALNFFSHSITVITLPSAHAVADSIDLA